MKTWTMARLIWVVGVSGWCLLALALAFGLRMGLVFTVEQAGTMAFLAMVFSGAFLLALSQAWLALFSALSGRVLAVAGRGAEVDVQAFVGAFGFALTVGSVVGVLLTTASPPIDGSTFNMLPPSVYTVLLSGLVLIAMALGLELRWIGRYRVRCLTAET